MAWAVNGTPDTLGSAGDDLDIIDLTALKFNVFLVHMLASGDIQSDITTDNNSNTDYAYRSSQGGQADATFTGAAFVDLRSGLGQNGDAFVVCYGMNISGEEKLFQSWMINDQASGAGGIPDRNEVVGKVDTTTNSGQFTKIDVNNDRTGNYAIDSNLSALGTD